MATASATRVVREHAMHLAATPERVFPLLCPVREHDWIEGWAAEIVHSASGVAEKGCVFTTGNAHGERSVWTVSRYDPAAAIEFVIVTPGLHVATLEVALAPAAGGTQARWRRAFTPLTAAGERAVAVLAGSALDERMDRLERQLDHYLRTGAMLRA